MVSGSLSRDQLTDGLVLAVEPMLMASPSRAVEAGDGWQGSNISYRLSSSVMTWTLLDVAVC